VQSLIEQLDKRRLGLLVTAFDACDQRRCNAASRAPNASEHHTQPRQYKHWRIASHRIACVGITNLAA
jgi:hypothetical protein